MRFSLMIVRSLGNIFFLTCLANICLAQVEQQRANHWYFGNQQGLDFSDGIAKRIENSQIDAVESCCTMSDLNGNLLFYTNGGGREDGESFGGIWNKDHELMEGGDLGTTLGGGQSAFQGCLTVPIPNQEDKYYLFTIDHLETLSFQNSNFPEGKGCTYFEIDVAANNGKGKVGRGQPILNPSFEYIAGTKHGNCEDYWVILQTSHHYVQRNADAADSFYVFQITESGVSPPIKIPMIEGRAVIRDEYGPMKISPDGKRLTCGLYLYDFDNYTGQINNPQLLFPSILDPTASLAFSPNGQYLYNFRLNSIGDTTFVYAAYQYDLAAPQLDSSEIIIGTKNLNLTSRGRVGTPQLAPDGKLYVPFWIGKPFSKIAITSISQPDKRGLAANFTFDEIHLSDGLEERFLRFGNFMDYIFKEKEETIFRENTHYLQRNCEEQEVIILAGPPNKKVYVWSENSTAANLEVIESGKYWVNYAKGCEVGADTFILEINNSQFDVSLPEDIVFLCENEQVLLQPENNSAMPLMWQDSSLEENFLVKQAGIYTVEAKLGLCIARDSTEVIALEKPKIDLGRDTLICKGNAFKLTTKYSPYNQYEWQDGQTDTVLNVFQAGMYELKVSNYCGEMRDRIEVAICPDCELYIPNVFSPNGDNQNDYFQAYPNEKCSISDFSLKIIDKWGNGRLLLTNLDQGWDGNFHQQRSAEGVYMYVARYTVNWPDGRKESKTQIGDVTLIR